MTATNPSNEQPLFPPAGTSGEVPRLQSLDGRPLNELGPDDQVLSGSEPSALRPSRQIIVSAGDVLTYDGRPLSEAPDDGVTEKLDPNQRIAKLGGEVISTATNYDDPRNGTR